MTEAFVSHVLLRAQVGKSKALLLGPKSSLEDMKRRIKRDGYKEKEIKAIENPTVEFVQKAVASFIKGKGGKRLFSIHSTGSHKGINPPQKELNR